MAKGPQDQTQPPLALLAGVIGFIILVGLLNICNIARHPGASKVWLAIVATATIVAAVGAGIAIWSRRARGT